MGCGDLNGAGYVCERERGHDGKHAAAASTGKIEWGAQSDCASRCSVAETADASLLNFTLKFRMRAQEQVDEMTKALMDETRKMARHPEGYEGAEMGLCACAKCEEENDW